MIKNFILRMLGSKILALVIKFIQLALANNDCKQYKI